MNQFIIFVALPPSPPPGSGLQRLGNLTGHHPLLPTPTATFVVDGKSDDTDAARCGNPTRDPEKPYGDTPLGDYKGFVLFMADTDGNRRSYGSPDDSGKIPAVLLAPIQGVSQAWRAKLNGRVGLMIHSGVLNGAGQLRPTHGCIRMREEDMKQLMAFLNKFPTDSIQVSVEALEIPT